MSGYTLGSGNAGSSSFLRDGTATWHGGLADVMVTRPGRTAANDALVPIPGAARTSVVAERVGYQIIKFPI